MNNAQDSNQDGSSQPAAGMNLEDVYFTLFRHKWMILAFVCAGALAAALVPLVHPAPYVSWAKLMIPFVVDTKSAALSGSDTKVTSTEMGGQGALNTEMEILKSADVATKAAEAVGPERILARRGGPDDLASAAGVILSGIEVENPRGTDILIVSFKHRNKDVTKDTLIAVLQAYKDHHLEVHMGGSDMDHYYEKQIQEWRGKLNETDLKLRKAKADAGVLSIEDAKKVYQEELLKWEERLREAQGELAERTAIHPSESPASAVTNAAAVMPPADKIEEYSATLTGLDEIKKKKRELFDRGYAEGYPLVQNAQARIDTLQHQKRALEADFPALAAMGGNAAHTGTNSLGADMADDLAAIRKLTARVTYIGTVISNIQVRATQVGDHEAEISGLTISRNLIHTNYETIASLVQQSLVRKDLSAVNGTMSIVQSPTPAARDMKKLQKLIGGAFAGLAGLGLALAFFFDLVINKTIRRSADIERQLHLPVFLTIPDATWTGNGLKLPWAKSEPSKEGALAIAGEGGGETAVVPWAQGEQMDAYLDGLKERLMTYFEVHNLNMKKPKLVAVTGCEKGAGVSTVASGLAAALSRNGDGSVLLVDMNKGHGLAKSFSKGDVTRGLTEMLQSGGHEDAKIQDNLYMATADPQEDGSPAKSLPSKFNHLVPKLKASDYDYIIFDMPPVTQTSATPRLASYMDITLMVLESEKTGQQMAERASALLRAARANVAAVLNKYRPHVPARLSHEL